MAYKCESHSFEPQGLVGLWPQREGMSFREAKSLPNVYVIMEGDYRGQCYLTAPMTMVKCQEKGLTQLLHDLDSIYWDHVEGTLLTLAQHKPGDFIDSGGDGGMIQEGLWIHNHLTQLGMEDSVRRVLSGRGSLTDSPSELAQLRERFLSQLRSRPRSDDPDE